MSQNGTLYLVGTPIGNLDDMSLRGVHVLKNVDLIACEDTRHAKKLLQHFEIKAKMTSYFEGNETRKAKTILSELLGGKDVAVISNAGTPGISDPGYRIVRLAIDHGITIIPIPGPTALICALIASGLPTHRFAFEGFLHQKTVQRKKRLLSLVNEERTLIFYETCARLDATLGDMIEVFRDRIICVARELTKIHEIFLRGAIREVRESLNKLQLKGELVLVIEGNSVQETWEDISIADHVKMIEEKMGLSKKEAMRIVADLRGLSKRDIYQTLIDDKT